MSFWTDYKNGLKLQEAEEILDLYFFRPLAFILVKIVYPFPITPNMLTAVSMILGLLSGYLYSYGQADTTLIAGFVFLISNVIDCSDGQLARLKKNGTKTGRIVDGMADYVTFTATTLGIAIGYSHTFESNIAWGILVGLTAISLIVQSILLDYYRNEFIGITTGKVQTTEDEYNEFLIEYDRLSQSPGNLLDKFLIKIYLLYTKTQLGKKTANKINADSLDKDNYYALNIKLIRGWTFIGSTTHISIAIIASFFNRPEYYFIIVVSIQNLMALILYIKQQKTNVAIGLK